MEKKEFLLEQLKFIYEKQHYFVDRHETMAEKYFTVLTLLAGTLTLLMTINSEKILFLKTIVIVSYIIFILFFCISLICLIKIINPLSTNFMNKHKDIKNNKNWIDDSSIYYRGIINKFNNLTPQNFIDNLTYDNYTLDLAKQISILAKYSDNKRIKLEKLKIYIYFAIVFSIINLILLIISVYLSKEPSNTFNSINLYF